MWNDRDCNEKNYFLCERPLSDGKLDFFCVIKKIKLLQYMEKFNLWP